MKLKNLNYKRNKIIFNLKMLSWDYQLKSNFLMLLEPSSEPEPSSQPEPSSEPGKY